MVVNVVPLLDLKGDFSTRTGNFFYQSSTFLTFGTLIGQSLIVWPMRFGRVKVFGIFSSEITGLRSSLEFPIQQKRHLRMPLVVSVHVSGLRSTLQLTRKYVRYMYQNISGLRSSLDSFQFTRKDLCQMSLVDPLHIYIIVA